MTRKIKKEKGPDPDTGNMMYEEIYLSAAQELIYDLLIRIADKVNA